MTASPTLEPSAAPSSAAAPSGRRSNHQVIATSLIFVLALAWFWTLSGLLQVRPNTLVTREIDVLFSADAGGRWQELTGLTPAKLSVSHPLLTHVFGRLGAALRIALSAGMPDEHAGVYASRLMVVTSASVGVTALLFLALKLGSPLLRVALLMPVCLLFTSNVLIVLPDHPGLSFGLMALASLALLPGLTLWQRLAWLGATGVLTAGVTLTNGLWPAMLAAAILLREKPVHAMVLRYRVPLALAGVLMACVLAFLVVHKANDKNSDTIVSRFTTFRLIKDPPAAAMYAALSPVYPAVAPEPRSRLVEGHVSLTYNPFSVGGFSQWAAAAAAAWTLLLLRSAWILARHRELRELGSLLGLWFLFNVLFHNIWGDEFFLYSAHWSWALMLAVLAGCRALPWPMMVLCPCLILPGQAQTLASIVRAISP